MKSLPFLGLMSGSLLIAASAIAQVDSEAIADELNTAWENAQARAGRPGDEALSCDQLKMEWDTAQNDPTVRQELASLEAGAQEAMRRFENAKTLGMALGVGRTALAAATATQQGAEWINLFAAYLQIGIMTAQANAAAPLAASMKNSLLSIMPHFARTSHVVLVAQRKGCLPQR